MNNMLTYIWLNCTRLQQQYLLIAVRFVVTAAGTLLGVLSLDAARAATAQRRAQAEVDVLLRVEAHHVAWDVHHLLAHADVALADEHTSVVNALGKPKFEDL